MEAGSNVRILGCALGLLINLYAGFIALTASGIFVVMPRILIEVLPFWFGHLISSISNLLIFSCNFTTCVMTIGIVAAMSKDNNVSYLFVGFLSLSIVLECTCWYFVIHLPTAHTTDKVGHHLSVLINNDITRMERRLIQRVETLEEIDQQPMARLQRTLTCCGVDSTKTWGPLIAKSFRHLSNNTFPISCCSNRNANNSSYFCAESEVFKVTCVDRAIFYFYRFYRRYLRIGCTLVIFQIIILLYFTTRLL